jgi:hypothetical protein
VYLVEKDDWWDCNGYDEGDSLAVIVKNFGVEIGILCCFYSCKMDGWIGWIDFIEFGRDLYILVVDGGW